jgi:CheY-like chemotaxis protein
VSRNCVLVVDDDDLVRETMVELIQDYGCTATGAANGLQAIEVLLTSENRICLVFLDLAMPVMDGAAFREEQLKRAEIKDIPVVLMSAFGNLRNGRREALLRLRAGERVDIGHPRDVAPRGLRSSDSSIRAGRRGAGAPRRYRRRR